MMKVTSIVEICPKCENVFLKMGVWEKVLWHSGLGCHLLCWPIWVLATPLAIQVPASKPGKGEDGTSIWAPATLVGAPDGGPGFGLIQPQLLRPPGE